MVCVKSVNIYVRRTWSSYVKPHPWVVLYDKIMTILHHLVFPRHQELRGNSVYSTYPASPHGNRFNCNNLGLATNTASAMEEKGKKAAADSSCNSNGGLVCKYQLKGNNTSQFIFLRVDHVTGALQIDYSLSFSTESRLRILSSCNGLLLLSQAEKKQIRYLVFDPVSNICVPLPPTPCNNKNKILRSGLASNGSDFHVMLVHLNRIPHEESAGYLELQVFSSSSGKWRTYCPTNLSLPLSPNKFASSLTSKVFRPWCKTSFREAVTPPIFSNGSIHWTISRHLLVYHVKSGDCELIELPYADEGGRHHHHCLWESGGRVKVSYTDESGVHSWHLLTDEDYDAYFGLNIYDRDKLRWRLEATISHEQLRRREAECCRTLRQWKAGDVSPITCVEAAQLMYLQIPEGIMSYNADNQALKLVCKLMGQKGCCSFFPFSYTGLNSKKCKGGSVDGAAVNLPVENLVNHVYF